jgi:hypothetical protein
MERISRQRAISSLPASSMGLVFTAFRRTVGAEARWSDGGCSVSTAFGVVVRSTVGFVSDGDACRWGPVAWRVEVGALASESAFRHAEITIMVDTAASVNAATNARCSIVIIPLFQGRSTM